MKSTTLKYNSLVPTHIYCSIYEQDLVQVKKETAKTQEYRVSNNANIVHLWKTRNKRTNLEPVKLD